MTSAPSNNPRKTFLTSHESKAPTKPNDLQPPGKMARGTSVSHVSTNTAEKPNQLVPVALPKTGGHVRDRSHSFTAPSASPHQKPKGPDSVNSASASVNPIPSSNSRDKIKRITSNDSTVTDSLDKLVQLFEAFASVQKSGDLSENSKKQGALKLKQNIEEYISEAFEKEEARRKSFGLNCHDFEHKIPGGVSHSESHVALKDFLERQIVLDFTQKKATSRECGSNKLMMQGLFKVSESPLLNALKVKKAYQEIISQLESLMAQYQAGEVMDDKIEIASHQTTEEVAEIINEIIEICKCSFDGDNDKEMQFHLKFNYESIVNTLKDLIEKAVNPTIEGLYRESKLTVFSDPEVSIVKDGKIQEKSEVLPKDKVIIDTIGNFLISNEAPSSILKWFSGSNIKAGVQAEILRPITTGSLTILQSASSEKIFPKEKKCIAKKRRLSSTQIQEALCKEFHAFLDTLCEKIKFSETATRNALKQIIAGMVTNKLNLKQFMADLGFQNRLNLTDDQVTSIKKTGLRKRSRFIFESQPILRDKSLSGKILNYSI